MASPETSEARLQRPHLSPPPARPRSNSLSELGVQSPSATSRLIQEHFSSFDERPRCTCGRLFPTCPYGDESANFSTPASTFNQSAAAVSDASQCNIHDPGRHGLSAKDDVNLQAEVEDESSTKSYYSGSEDDDVSYTNDLDQDDWTSQSQEDIHDSGIEIVPSVENEWPSCADIWTTSTQRYTPSIPTPNDLTQSYLPFSFHSALTNFLSASFINSSLSTPIFIHSTLQLPATLSHLLSMPLQKVIRKLTPALLLNHTTLVCPTTLLPSLVPATEFPIHSAVKGLLFFPPLSKTSAAEEVEAWYNLFHSSQTLRLEKRQAQVKVVDQDGEIHVLDSWTWVSVAEARGRRTKAEEDEHDEEIEAASRAGERAASKTNQETEIETAMQTNAGTEEWWTLEEYVAGRIVGLGAVEW